MSFGGRKSVGDPAGPSTTDGPSIHGLPRPSVHKKARSSENKAYASKRMPVPDEKVPWTVPWPDYDPPDWTHEVVLKQPPWADKPDASLIDFSKQRRSFEGKIVVDSMGRPLNPRGRTGLRGRGLLGKFGPNHAADPIVMRRKPGSARADNRFQMVAIIRQDGGKWAIPGGMVDDGELVSQTLRREFSEEATAAQNPKQKQQITQQLDQVFASGGHLVYEGYVDDPRNTDNAWMETTVRLFFIDEPVASQLPLAHGSDAAGVRWRDLDARLLSDASQELYADHKVFIRLALDLCKRLGH